MNEDHILHFLRSMRALEDHTQPWHRYELRGNNNVYVAWDTYLLMEVPIETTHVDAAVRFVADLNAVETSIQHDYNKQREHLDA
jgi:hypothetical protein